MHKAIERWPRLGQVGEHGIDLLIATDIAVEDQLRVELFGEFGDAVLEAITHIAEGQFGALALASLGDAPEERIAVAHQRAERRVDERARARRWRQERRQFLGAQGRRHIGRMHLSDPATAENRYP